MEKIQKLIEERVGYLIVLTFLVISVAMLVEILPLMFQKSTTQPAPGVKPYTALQLTGLTSMFVKVVITVTHR